MHNKKVKEYKTKSKANQSKNERRIELNATQVAYALCTDGADAPSSLKNYINNVAAVNGKNVCLDIELMHSDKIIEIRRMILTTTYTAEEKAEIVKLVNAKKTQLGRLEKSLNDMIDDCVITYKNRDDKKLPTNVSMYETYINEAPSTRLYYKAGILGEAAGIMDVVSMLIQNQSKFRV